MDIFGVVWKAPPDLIDDYEFYHSYTLPKEDAKIYKSHVSLLFSADIRIFSMHNTDKNCLLVHFF